MTGEVARIAEALAQRMETLVEALDLGGTRQGVNLTPLNPTRADRKPGSFVINLRTGRWDDFATAEGGDALDLVAYVKFGDPSTREAKYEAIRWAQRWLGWPNNPERLHGGTEKLERARVVADAHAEQERAEAARELARKRGIAFRDWLQAPLVLPPDDGGEPSPAWRYFTETRALPIWQLARWPSAIRWTNGARHVETDRTVPAIVSGLFAPGGEVVAIHRIFLERDGRKIEGAPVKKIWPGGFLGAFIPISRGASGWPVAKAAQKGFRDVLFYCEGVEDGLTAALLAPAWRVNAVGVARNFAAQNPPECAEQVIVGRDNEKDAKVRATVDRHCNQLRETCRERGLIYAETRATGGHKDFNDMVRADG